MSDDSVDRHFDDAVLATIVDGTDPLPEAIAHLSECDDCRRRLSAVAHLVDDAEISDEIERLERPVRIVPARRWRRSSIGVIATVAVAAAAAIVLLRPGALHAPAPVSDSSEVLREGTITTTAPPRILGPLATAAPGDSLRWTSVPGADIYRVQVWNTEGSVVLSTDTRDTTLGLPQQLARSGATYLWDVKARTGWDRWVSSEFLRFTVRNK